MRNIEVKNKYLVGHKIESDEFFRELVTFNGREYQHDHWSNRAQNRNGLYQVESNVVIASDGTRYLKVYIGRIDNENLVGFFLYGTEVIVRDGVPFVIPWDHGKLKIEFNVLKKEGDNITKYSLVVTDI